MEPSLTGYKCLSKLCLANICPDDNCPFQKCFFPIEQNLTELRIAPAPACSFKFSKYPLYNGQTLTFCILPPRGRGRDRGPGRG